MQILVHSDHTVTGSESLTERVEAIVAGAIDRFANRITRIDAHLSDVNGVKHGERDKRCMLEVRVGGVKPIAVSHQAAHMADAVNGAAEKLERALSHALERLDDKSGRTPREDEIASVDTFEQLESTERGAKR